MKVINMLKDIRDKTMKFSISLPYEIHLRGDVFKEEFDMLAITVPLNHKHEIDNKFIRFIESYHDLIKVVIVVVEGCQVIQNLNEVYCDNIVIIDFQEDDLNKKKQVIESVLEKEYCKLLEVRELFKDATVTKDLSEIESHVELSNNMNGFCIESSSDVMDFIVMSSEHGKLNEDNIKDNSDKNIPLYRISTKDGVNIRVSLIEDIRKINIKKAYL